VGKAGEWEDNHALCRIGRRAVRIYSRRWMDGHRACVKSINATLTAVKHGSSVPTMLHSLRSCSIGIAHGRSKECHILGGIVNTTPLLAIFFQWGFAPARWIGALYKSRVIRPEHRRDPKCRPHRSPASCRDRCSMSTVHRHQTPESSDGEIPR
jgi:hypothetical protein